MSNEKHIFSLKISKVIDNQDGTSVLNFDLTDDFIDWFNERQGDVDFSHEKFSTFISEVIKSGSPLDDGSGIIGRITSG